MQTVPRFGLIFVAIFASCMTLTSTAEKTNETKPPKRLNILVFMADDQYKSSVGCYGADPSHTPNIDRLAAQGLKFNQCITESSMCTANRAVFLSGMYPLRNSV